MWIAELTTKYPIFVQNKNINVNMEALEQKTSDP